MKLYKITGNLAITLGIICALTCLAGFLLHTSFLFYGVFLSFLGFVASVIHIFIATKLQIEKGFFSKGYVAMFLSSLPILILVVLTLLYKN